jgi:hypothetical protein
VRFLTVAGQRGNYSAHLRKVVNLEEGTSSMTQPVTPQSRAKTLETTAAEPANDSVFPGKAGAGPAGWDPYEVWRTRVLAAAQTAGDEKG